MRNVIEVLVMSAVMFICSYVFTNMHYGMGYAGIMLSLGIGTIIGVVAYHRAGEEKKSLLRWLPISLLAFALCLIFTGLYLHLG